MLLLCTRMVQAVWKLGDMLGEDDQARVVYRPQPIDAKFENPISDGDEHAFQQWARNVVAE